jgi:hypothetical protein
MEFWASVDYYEEQEPGLGVRFKLEVDQFIAKIEADSDTAQTALQLLSSGEPVRVPPLYRLRDSWRFGFCNRHLPCSPKARVLDATNCRALT